jgi:hypothetical protein
MVSQKQHLIDKNKEEVEKIKKEVDECEAEITRLNIDLKVEKKIFDEKLANMLDDYVHNGVQMKEIKENVQGNIGALESMIAIEHNRLYELKTNFEIARLRKEILKEDDMDY